MRSVKFEDWGEIGYHQAWQQQTKIKDQIIQAKRAGRQKDNYFIFCRHAPIYTIGKSGNPDNLKLNLEQLNELNVEAIKINRGGDITFHGPGQIIGYPILDLDEFFTDIHKYIRFIEEVIIRTLRGFGIIGFRLKNFTGVWIKNDHGYAKVCAIGVHLSRWVTMHGFALNVNSDLSYFDNIVPCGIVDSDKSVTSLQAILKRAIDHFEVKDSIQFHFKNLFKTEIE